MNAEERVRLIQLINNPSEGGKIAAARDFGIDLTLLIRKLELTPTARIRELAAAQGFIAELQRAKREGR